MKMKGRTRRAASLLALALVFLAGCASLRPVPLDPGFWQREQGRRVGVALLAFPQGETLIDAPRRTPFFIPSSRYSFGGMPWNDEYDDYPLRLAETRPLRQAVERLDAREFSRAQDLFVEGLKAKGFAAFKIEEPVEKKQLPRFKDGGDEAPYEGKDYRELGKASNADYLVLVELVRYGPYCHYIDLYNDYLEVQVHARAVMLDAGTNRILWRTGWSQGDFRRAVDAAPYRPDKTPAVIDAQKALLGDAAASLARELFSPATP